MSCGLEVGIREIEKLRRQRKHAFDCRFTHSKDWFFRKTLTSPRNIALCVCFMCPRLINTESIRNFTRNSGYTKHVVYTMLWIFIHYNGQLNLYVMILGILGVNSRIAIKTVQAYDWVKLFGFRCELRAKGALRLHLQRLYWFDFKV